MSVPAAQLDPESGAMGSGTGPPGGDPGPRFSFLPKVNSTGYYVLLACVAIFILGPLGGVTAAFMNFSLGFFVGGQVLAGILGSAVTYGYGPEGKHGANYMQTMAASVASMSGMAVLIQAMVWLGMPMPEAWRLVIFFTCIGMLGVGIGMLYTPILVDKLQLEYPSGHAVANILRALTDKRLLKRSIGQLGGGTVLGGVIAWVSDAVPVVGEYDVQAATIGAGMVVGSRIGVPAALVGGIGWAMTPWLRSIGWLGPHDPFRKIGFLAALAMIVGAAVLDLTLIGIEAVGRMRTKTAIVEDEPEWKRVKTGRLLAWVGFWSVAVVLASHILLDQPIGYVVFALGLTFLFVFINGIADGISDSNPISSAFVVSVLLMSALGLKSPIVALMAAAILLVGCSTGVDMQQDRSTGWRLGTNRNIQFRFQVIGIVMGAVVCVAMAKLFMTAYPVLTVNSFVHPEAKVGQWQSAMTYKFVGAMQALGTLPRNQLIALSIGFGIGLTTEILRKLIHKSPRYKAYVASSKTGYAVGWLMDALILPSPYASSFGGFVQHPVSFCFAGGSVISSLYNVWEKRRAASKPKEDDLPEDMSTTSLIGGGLIAGDSLYALFNGLKGLIGLVH